MAVAGTTTTTGIPSAVKLAGPGPAWARRVPSVGHQPRRLGRALRNLVTNAIRHTPSDGGVDVLAEVQSGMACVSGPDPRHGCGETGLPLFGALRQMG